MVDAAGRLRVAVAGIGFFAGYQLRAWRRLGRVDLVALYNRTHAKAARAAREFGVDEAFDDLGLMLARVRPDLLDIVTPPATHRMMIEAAIAHGASVICQKPFCRSRDEALAVTEMAERAGATLIVHENFRFQPWHEETRRLVADGAVGQPYQATFRLRPGDGLGVNAYLARQPYFREMERFLVRETGVHFVDTLRALMGEVTAVQARLRRLNPVIRGEDSGLVLMEFGDGPWGVIDGNRLVDHATDAPRRTMGELIVEGSEGMLRIDGTGEIHRRHQGEPQWRRHAYQWDDQEFGGDCAFRLQRAAVEHTLEGRPMANLARDFMRNLDVEDAIYRSHAEGRRILLTPEKP